MSNRTLNTRPTPQHILITGSSRGIGFGLADAFLEPGCHVTVSGRSRESTAAALGQFVSKHEQARLPGLACDVTRPEQVTPLWEGSAAHFGGVDIWVNNAGCSAEVGLIREGPAEEIQSVIATNLLGTISGSRAAFCGMRAVLDGASKGES